MIVSGIPKMEDRHREEAKRFITLIDELYNHKVRSPRVLFARTQGRGPHACLLFHDAGQNDLFGCCRAKATLCRRRGEARVVRRIDGQERGHHLAGRGGAVHVQPHRVATHRDAVRRLSSIATQERGLRTSLFPLLSRLTCDVASRRSQEPK